MPTPMNSGNKQSQPNQAAPDGSQPIGRVETLEGEVTATRADGGKISMAQDAPVYQGDTIETGEGAKVSILFTDSSTFALGGDGQIVLDELVYDPKTHDGQSLTTITKGVFVFVSGEIAANNPDAMQVHTPVMVIGVRGTKVAGVANPEGQENKVALLADEDGSIGSVVVTNDAGSVVLDAANEMTRILFGNVAPSVPEIVTQAIINELFGETLSFLPILGEIGAATGLFDAIGGMLGAGSGSDQDNARDGNGDSQSEESGGGFFDSLFPEAGGSDQPEPLGAPPGDGSWLDLPPPHHAAPGYSLFVFDADPATDGFAPSIGLPGPTPLA